MRWWGLLSIIALAVPAPAVAKDCYRSSTAIISVVEWTAEKGDRGGAKVTFVVRNDAKKQLEMIDATVWFNDILGDGIGGIAVDRDLRLAPGETYSQVNNMIGMERLTTVAPKNISTVACTEAVLYADGSTEKFN